MNHRTRSYLLFVLLIGCICYLVSHFVVQLYFVNGSSMEPTYTSGQPVLLQKFGLPDCLDYNDVVVIRHETLGRNIVKRIVALPGDTVQITEGILYVNGVPQPTPDGFSLMEDAGNAAAPLTLAPGEYFVLGDNRNHSIDSRFAEVGIIPAASIAWPFWRYSTMCFSLPGAYSRKRLSLVSPSFQSNTASLCAPSSSRTYASCRSS